MKRFQKVCICLGWFVSCVVSISFMECRFALAQDSEPQQTFQLEIGGKPFDIESGKEIEIDFTGKTRVKLIPSPTRVFGYGGISFQYPNNFAWESEIDDGSYQWVMDGNNIVLMVFGFHDMTLGHREFADSIATSYDNFEIDSCSIEIGGARWEGTNLLAEAFDEWVSQQIYSIDTKDGSRLFIIQDVLQNQSKDHSEEYHRILKMLDGTFRITSESIR